MRNLVLVTALMALVFSSCEDDNLSTTILTDTRELSDFNKIHLDGVGDVEYVIDNEFKVEITTHADLMQDVKTYVSNSELHIDLNGNNQKIKTLYYKVYAPEVNEFKITGVGDINCMDLIEVDQLNVLQDGVGDINLNEVKATSIFARMSDVGNIYLSGLANDVIYRMDGVGNIKAFDLEAAIGNVKLDGVGNIEVNATDDLTIDHDGVGKVFYMGNPDIHLSGDGGDIIGAN